MKEKVDLAKQIIDASLFPTDYIYDYLFHMSEDKYDEMRDLVVEDKKRMFRLSQIENEGNDPVTSGQSYGTPHDLATLYGKGRNGVGDTGAVPPGYDEKRPVGRPEEKASIIGTQDHSMGKDRLGSKENSPIYTANIPDEGSGIPKGGSPLALAENLRYKHMLKGIKDDMNNKQNIFETQQGSSLLDEENIKDI